MPQPGDEVPKMSEIYSKKFPLYYFKSVFMEHYKGTFAESPPRPEAPIKPAQWKSKMRVAKLIN